MSWRDLLSNQEEITLPWVGGRSLCLNGQVWKITGKLPEEYAWYSFIINGRKILEYSVTNQKPEILTNIITGYLVGNRIVSDKASVNPDPNTIIKQSEQVFLIEDGIDRFSRISAGRTCDDGPLFFRQQEFPLGPEADVLQAYLDNDNTLDKCKNIKGVTPALDATFRMEIWQRIETERRRQELERLRLEEEAKLALEARRNELIANIGNAQTRRELARVDFGEAARAALRVGGASYLDHRQSPRRREMIVRFSIGYRRFECVCDALSLRIIDSGICLTRHDGVKGDTWLTLESLPSVINEAIRDDLLVVYRHVN